jgi:hypothetical protein
MLVDSLPRILLVMSLVAAILILGNLAPALLIGDNVDGFVGIQRIQAETAKQAARSFVGGSLEPAAIRALRVEEVIDESPQASTRCRGSGRTVAHAALVRVQFYTAFGLPWSAVVVEACDEGRAGVSRIRGGLFDHGMIW